MPCGTFNVDLACLKYISIGNKWKTGWWSLWSHQPFSERDGYNSRVVPIIYSGEDSFTCHREDSTLALVLHHKSDMAIASQRACFHEWTALWMKRHHSGGDKGSISDTCSVIKRDVFRRVYHMCQEEIGFCARLEICILWEQGNPNRHTSFFLRKHVVWQIPPLLWVMLIKASIGHSAPSKSFCNTDGLLRLTTLRTALYEKSMALHLAGKWSGCGGWTVIITISEGNWCYWCIVSEKYSSCTMSLKGHIMYFTDNIACRCVGCGTWYIIIKCEYRLRVYEGSMLDRTFVPK
jgi:hypothetical protein